MLQCALGGGEGELGVRGSQEGGEGAVGTAHDHQVGVPAPGSGGGGVGAPSWGSGGLRRQRTDTMVVATDPENWLPANVYPSGPLGGLGPFPPKELQQPPSPQPSEDPPGPGWGSMRRLRL